MGCAFSNNFVTGYSDFDFDRIFDIRRLPIGNLHHMIKTSMHDTMETKNVLNMMSLAPQRYRIIGPRGEEKEKRLKNPIKTQQQSGIWRLISTLKISDILHLNKMNWIRV